MACTEVIEPFLVDVMRSCNSPISVARLGWYPTADGMRPSSEETSEPACVKRKMLSMKSSTSRPSSSRKYSAIASADSATRARAPGGAFTDTGEHGIAAVFRCDVVNEFLDEYGFAHTGAAEQTGFAAFQERTDQI